MTIVLSEIDTTSLVPRVAIELDITYGASGGGAGPRKVYIMGERLATGTSSDNEVTSTPFGTWGEADDFFGAGSFGSYMAAIAFLTTGGDRVPIYGAALPDAAGTKAQGVFTASGTSSTAGVAVCRIGGVTWTTTIAASSTPQNTTDAIVAEYAKIDAILKPPVTLTSQIQGAGPAYEVEIEANNSGAHANTLPIEVVSFTPGTQTLTADAATLGTNQAGVGVVTLTTVLGNLDAVRTHYIAFDDYIAGSTTQACTAIKNHLIAKAEGDNMLGGRAIVGFTGTVANAVTLAGAVDSNDAERMIVVACEGCKSWEPAIAASTAVLEANKTDVAAPSDYMAHNMLVPPASSYRFTDTECNTCLAGGVSPLRTLEDGDTQITTVRLVTMRNDVAVPLDNSTMEVYDELRDRIRAKQQARYKGFKIKENGQDVHTAKCTTPNAILADTVVSTFKEMEEEDKVQGVDDNIDSFVAEYVTGGQCRWRAPASAVPGLHQIYGQIAGVASV